MIRSSKLSIAESNINKLHSLSILTTEMTNVINLYIDILWSNQNFSSKFVDFKVDTWLSARLQQCLGKQALEIVKSQRQKKKKTKPNFTGTSFNLDSRFVDIQYDNRYFDLWIKLSSLGNGLFLKLPAHAHKQYNKYKDWNKNTSIRLLNRPTGYFIEVFFEKSEPEKKDTGTTVGFDIGYKELLVSSENKVYDTGLTKVYEKLSRKQQGSKSFKRSLRERDNLINQSINNIDLSTIKEIVVEDLKNVKKNSKGKISKKFNNKLQRWSYPKVLEKLSHLTEEAGIYFTKINPAYTSQKCSNCGTVKKDNRKGKDYSCSVCGLEIDADYNASINISRMGIYSSHTQIN